MARLTAGSVPQYRKHRGSDQAIVVLSGQMFYLGPHGSRTSKHEYDRLIAEWLAAGRKLPSEKIAEPIGLSVAEVCERYSTHAAEYYKSGDGKSGELPALLALAYLPPIREASWALRLENIEQGLAAGREALAGEQEPNRCQGRQNASENQKPHRFLSR